MGQDVKKDDPEITVRTMSPIHQRGPVFYASLPLDMDPRAGQGTNEGAKGRLVSLLWDHFLAMESSVGKGSRSSAKDALPIRVIHDPLGKPLFLLGERPGPAISFSEGGGKLWAALSGDESQIGIDVAGADEFPGEYPFHRAFHALELQKTMVLVKGDAAKASALLWSIKEAVVKALGCAFHLVDPREIDVRPSDEGDGEYVFSAGLSRRALARFPGGDSRPVWVRSLPRLNVWLSVALVKGQQP